MRSLVGKAVDELNLTERLAHANEWMAFLIYEPPSKVTRDGVEYVDVRERRIEAAGKNLDECISQHRSLGVDPVEYEFTPLKPPY